MVRALQAKELWLYLHLLPSLVHESHHHQSPFHMKASIVNVWGKNIDTVLNCQEPMKTSITILESGVAGRVWYAQHTRYAKHKDFSYFGESTPRNVPFFLRPQYTGNKTRRYLKKIESQLQQNFLSKNGIIRSQNACSFPSIGTQKLAACAFLAHSILTLDFFCTVMNDNWYCENFFGRKVWSGYLTY